MPYSPAQAEGVFDVLVDELDVDLALRDDFITAFRNGAERIQFSGFSSAPKSKRPRLIILGADPTRLKSPDKARLSDEQWAAAQRASARIDDALRAPACRPPTGALGRLRLSPLAA
jgi:hypothetical protein